MSYIGLNQTRMNNFGLHNTSDQISVFIRSHKVNFLWKSLKFYETRSFNFILEFQEENLPS